jgi:hypothetical protein
VGEFRYIRLGLKREKGLLLSRTLLVAALCATGIVAVGCFRTDRVNENGESQSDAGALQDATAVVGSRGGNGEGIDATLNPRNGNDSAIDQPPLQDAAPPDPIIDASPDLQSGNDSAIEQPIRRDASSPDRIEITDQCGVLRRWKSNDNVSSPLAIRGQDGFAVIRRSESSYSDPRDLYIYDAMGQEVGLFGFGVVPGSTSTSGWELVRGMKSGDRLAVSMRCSQKGGFCGHRIQLKNEEPKDAAGSGSYSDLGALEIRSTSSLLFTIAPNDRLLIGFGTGYSGFPPWPIEMAWLSPDVNQSSDVMTLSKSDVLGAAITNPLEKYGDACNECIVREFEVNEQGQTFVLLEYGEIVTDGVLQSVRFESHILVLSDDFTLMGDYQAPTDVQINAFRLIEQGRIIVAGSQGLEEQMQVWYNMLTVDESGVFSDGWPEARVDGAGQAWAIDTEYSGGFVLAGMDAAVLGFPWIQRYDDSGTPLWPQRVGVSSEESGSLFFSMDKPAVSIQSDGSIFLSFNNIAFVYCED